MTYRTATRTTRTTKTRGAIVILTKGQIKKLQNARKLILQLHNNLQTGIRKLGKKTTSKNQAVTCLQGINKLAEKFACNGLRQLKTVTKSANGKKRH